MSNLTKIIKWVQGTKAQAMKTLMRSVTTIHFGTPRERQGDKFGAGRGAHAAGVMWPVDPKTHDGAGFIAADSFWAIYIKADDTVYLIDSELTDDRHPGAFPLKVGKKITLSKKLRKDYFGLVVRTAEYGTDGFKKNVFIAEVPADGSSDITIIAHHLPNTPNQNSTLVFDPDGDGRSGPIDDQLFVRRYNPINLATHDQCSQGKTQSPVQTVPIDPTSYAVYWNCATSGVGENRGHGLTHFDDAEARMGFLMDGPLRPSSKKHLHTNTGDTDPNGANTGDIRAGALDLDALWTNGNEQYDAPNKFYVREEPDVVETEGIRHRVYHEMDSDDCHPSTRGKRKGKWNWSVPLPLIETPPCEGTADQPSYSRVDAPDIFFTGAILNQGMVGLPTPNLHKLAK